MWETAYLSIKIPKALLAVKWVLNSRLFTSQCQKLFSSEAGSPMAKFWIHTYTPPEDQENNTIQVITQFGQYNFPTRISLVFSMVQGKLKRFDL